MLRPAAKNVKELSDVNYFKSVFANGFTVKWSHMKYAVYRATNLVCCTVVEAESEEEAVNKAYGASYTVNSSECFVRNVVEKKEEGIRTYEIYGSTDVMCKAVEERV